MKDTKLGTYYDWAEPDTYEFYCLACCDKPEVLKWYADGHGSNTNPVQQLMTENISEFSIPGCLEVLCEECKTEIKETA
jgi:hypothetical protein